MEVKSFRFESKVDMDKNTFEGYAAIFGNVDSHNDTIDRGAFKKTLQESTDRVKVLWQHDSWNPIGIPVHMEEDSKGLYVKAKISQTQQGKDALILMKDGVINELSIGYNAIKHETDENTDIRCLKEVKLMEFSPVTWASNELATITGAKSSKELDKMLRGIGEYGNEDLIKKAIKSLQVLLDDFEPDNSTQKHKEPPRIKDNESDIHSLFKQMEEFKKSLGGM